MEKAKNITLDENVQILLNNTPLGCLLLNENFETVLCNQIAASIFKVEDADMVVGWKFMDIMLEGQPQSEQEQEYVKNQLDELTNNGRAKFFWKADSFFGRPLFLEVDCSYAYICGKTYLIVHIRELIGGCKLCPVLTDKKNLEQSLQDIIDFMPLMSNTFDKNFRIIDCNQKSVEIFEMRDKQEFMDRFSEISPEFQPDGMPSIEKAVMMISKAFDEGYVKFEWLDRKLDGEWVPSEVTLIRFEWKDEFYVVAFIQDLREFYKFKEAEQIAKQRLQIMLNSSPLACFIIDGSYDIVEVNHEVVSLFGLNNGQEFIDKFDEFSPKYQPDGMLSDEKLREKLSTAFDDGKAYFEWMFNSMQEKLIPCEVTMMRVELDEQPFVIAYMRDLREIKNAFLMMEQLEQLAYTDPLTGAYNRRYFTSSAEEELKKCMAKGNSFAIIMIDIDRFKTINDTYGHSIGDEVLKILVARMRHVLKQGTVAARFGGEEFIVMLPGISSDNVEKAAWRIQHAVESSKFVINDLSLDVTVSAGTYYTEDSSESLAQIIKKADMALYEAKNSGRNTVMCYR